MLRTLRSALAVVALATVLPAAPSAAPAFWTEAEAATLTPTTVAATTSSTYKVATYVGGRAVRWNPCAPIHWRANVARGPVGGLTALKTAVARVAAQTGTTWVYDGTSTAAPSTGWLPRTAQSSYRPVLIGWSDGATTDLLRNQPAGVAGMTRAAWFAKGTGGVFRTAVVALDRTDRLPLTGGQSWTALAQHELGHVMGLAHPASGAQLMAASLPATAASYQSGDSTGLSKLGRGAGCL